MTDPLSISVGIIAILDITNRAIKYGLDFAGAPKEIQELKEKFESLESVLRRLMERCDNAQKSDPDKTSPWLRGLWEVRGGRFDKNGVWVFVYKGIVAELKQAIEDAVAKLNPSREWKKAEAYQRARWHYKKDTFTEILTTVSSCFAAINTILALKNDETLSETLSLVKENNEYSISKLESIYDRMSTIELNQRREEERVRKEAEQIERLGIADWLSPLSFIAKQDELWTNCFQEVGEWLWKDESFHAWTEGRPWILQCVGAPGVGKTVLSSILTHHLPSKSQRHHFPILSLYLNYKSTNVQTLPHLIGSLLKQLIQIDETFLVSEELRNVFKKAKFLKLEPISYSQDIHKILVTQLARYDRFYIVVDGFDELPPRDRGILLRELLELRSEKGSLVITTRPISEQTSTGTYKCSECSKEFKLAFRCRVCNKGNYDLCYECKKKGFWCHNRLHPLTEPYGQVEVAVEIPEADIEHYVRWEVGLEVGDSKPALVDDRDTAVTDNPITTPFQDLCQTDPNLPEQIIAEVAKKANGRFLFARLYMDSLKSKSNLRMLKKALRTFPDDINDIYKEAMQRIQVQEPEERKRAYKILGMITHTRRPLSLQELQHALATADFQYEEGDTEDDIFDAIDQPKTIFGSTSALVHEENNHVRLVHRSLEDYLHIAENSQKWFPTADVEIASACMTYLNLVLPRKPCDDGYFIAKKKEFPFLQYASQYWGDHVRNASQNPEYAADIQKAALKLIEDSQCMSACMQAAWLTNPGGHDTWDVWRNIDRLHVCAWYGLSSILSVMQPDRSMVDRVEPKYGQTPLMYACRKGHSNVVRQFLELGASQQKVSARGRTALFEAILGHHSSHPSVLSEKRSKHGEVVELLVCEMPRDLIINMTHGQEFDRTALMLAARLGHLEMIKTLLKHEDVDVDLQDVNGMTAVYLAVREDHYDIVQLLLDAQAGIDIVDFHAGRSPLRCAAERNLCEMVDLLLQYNADPALKDREGGTAVLRAVNRGAKQALEKMMEYSFDLDCADEDGQSLLHGAARNGYHDIARLLLEDRSPEEKGLSPDIRDKYHMTPLHDASRHGDVAVVAVLLEHGANASSEDKFDRTPFIIAWQYGHESIMRMLADSGHQPQPNVSLNEEWLPVWSMAKRGLTDLIAHAIKTRDHDLHIPEPCTENSPLHCAVEKGDPDILSMLLGTKKLPVNKPNRFERTPLHVAALEGDYFATKCLIDLGANVDQKDRWKDEALVLAQSNLHLEVMLALIEANALVDKKKIDLKKLFFFAVDQRKVAAARILIEKHGVDRSIQNSDGLRAEQIAKAAEDTEMMLLLRSASTVSFVDAATTGPRSNELDNRKVPFRPFRSRPVEL
jgi:ankyrin repeat protein